ncbi:MAG: zinc-binding alcohol dehydrogenase family protein [Candidatus Nitrohelix vancouverensis]|uniref:Zinc-type alcohol dehydrogenase-like protein n=1 Tax=Candidatus Nitrohelix vancouverensis TaxID=2705534 RepID=A0A7T0C2G0_9BACT|nr:MAG: zinc-binding alcohol dehydrogenase family protein [Candidatus Nitrohelix vancouverensis]
MKAIGYQLDGGAKSGAFVEFEQQTPQAKGHDLLVRIEAVSVNPVDYKVRQGLKEAQTPPVILGWDAAGVVESVGDKVSRFKIGDRVYYAGDITRSGSNASHQLVEEHIVGRMPKSLDFAEAAALPLTGITAWEALFDRLKIDPDADRDKQILIIGGAGGVGSIAIQLAKKVAHLKVIATASREESRQWCLSLGADVVVNHRENMPEQFKQQGLAQPDYVLCLNDTDGHFKAMSELVAPQGMICSIVETAQDHSLDELKSKSAGFVWEFMFTRSMYATADRGKQHDLLNSIAELVDAGEIKSTLNEIFGELSAENISKAHQQVEAGASIGKIVLTQGWEKK